MLSDSTLRRYRDRLVAERRSLIDDDAARRKDRAPVTLDQQSVGRLSRMDALQRQALSQAESRRRHAREKRIEAALERLNDGEFGYCDDCGEAIAEARLDADPTSPLCLSCARG